jgi:hypothetical protein
MPETRSVLVIAVPPFSSCSVDAFHSSRAVAKQLHFLGVDMVIRFSRQLARARPMGFADAARADRRRD